MSSLKRKIGPLTLHIPAALIGVQILLKGIEKVESLGQHPLIVASLLLLGSFVLVASFLPLWLEKRIKHAHALLHCAKGVAMNLSAILLFEKGKLRIPIILVFIGLLYIVIGYVESKPQEQRERLAGPVLKGTAWAALAGGVSLALFTALGDRDPWALGVAGLLVVVGVTMLMRTPSLLRSMRAAGEGGVEVPNADAR
jgi:hypothetical protein